MQSSFYRRTMPKLILALVALTMGVFFSRGGEVHAVGTFGATTTAALSNNYTEGHADITVTLGIVINDYNFSAVINGYPSGAFIAPGPGNPGYVPGLHPAIGDVMGTLGSASTIGFTGGPCSLAVTPGFTFLNATVDNTDTIDAVPQASTQVGSGTTTDNMWQDNGASTTGPGALPPWNATWPGMDPGEADNDIPAQVDEYPNFLNALFDPDLDSLGADNVYGTGDDVNGPTPAVQPLARYAGAVNVVGNSVILNLVIFAPGALTGWPANHPFMDATPALGYKSVAVLNDPTTEASVSAITDFCSPLGTVAVTYGLSRANPCTVLPYNDLACDSQADISSPAPGVTKFARYANPSTAGVHNWDTQHDSLRDEDGDGVENSLDACPVNADTYNPRTDTGPDADNDGLPDICDDNDADGNTDADGDGWLNSGDNCPKNSNATQQDSEIDEDYATTAPSGGPKGDSIGDACDVNDIVSNGAFMESDSLNPIALVTHDEDEAGGPPNDGDGYTAANESGTPFCGNGINDDVKVGSPSAPDDAVADDGCSGGPAQAGLYSEAQFKIGTSSVSRCGLGSEGVPDLGRPAGTLSLTSQSWPSDFASGQTPSSTDKINIYDLSSYLAPTAVRRIGTSPGNGPFSSRWDLSPGPQVFALWINATDITTLTGANPAVPQNTPPMLGVRAWSGPACTE